MSALTDLIGKELGPTEWFEVDQARIEEFARATDDPQWIHVDPVRAAEGPFGTTIAHGFLTLSLCVPLMSQTLQLTGYTMGINYGVNRVRFPAPLPSGSRVRATFTVQSVEEVPGRRASRHPRDRRTRGRREAGVRRRARLAADPMKRFEGKTALVTGGAKGIGAATAERLAAEGAHVVVADFDEAAANETAERIGGRAVRCDVTSRADVEAAVAAAAESGRLDALVTCAGIIRDNLIHKLSDDDWEAVIATHLRGSFLAAQAAQAHMVEQGGGAMVLISSTSALGNRGQANYAAAKAGIQGLAKTLAIELGRFFDPRQLRGAGIRRDGDDGPDGGARGRAVRRLPEGRRGADAAQAHRPARRHRRRDRVPLLRRRRVRHRPGDLRPRRPVTRAAR